MGNLTCCSLRLQRAGTKIIINEMEADGEICPEEDEKQVLVRRNYGTKESDDKLHHACKELEKQGKTKEKFSAELGRASLLSAVWQRTRNRQKILKEPCVYFSDLNREVW